MKIHPHRINTKVELLQSPPPSRLCNPNTGREAYTLWMKSLILGGKGCTVFDSKGRVVYRVDNYGSKCCSQVFLMDCHGNVVLNVLRKRFRLIPTWEGYKDEKKGVTPFFRVTKCWKFTKKPLKYRVIVNLDHDNTSHMFKIEKGKSDILSCRIVDRLGGLIAEMKRKQSGGVVLGDDVLTLTVEASVDHSLIMGLMVVYSLIHSRI